jgi:hypothetical protein
MFKKCIREKKINFLEIKENFHNFKKNLTQDIVLRIRKNTIYCILFEKNFTISEKT